MPLPPIHTSVPVADQPLQWGRPITTWTRLTLLWLMAITVIGAAVRLTGSGLGCTDWPTCTVNTELDAPGFHSAIEFGNRVISGLAIIPVVAAWLAARKVQRPELTPWFVAMTLGFFGQVLLGMLVTRTELDPRMVLGHFLLSIVLIFIGVVIDYRVRVWTTGAAMSTDQTSFARRRLRARLLVAACAAVIVVGTLVTGSGPHAGSDTFGEPIPRLGFDIREVSRAHSLFGWLLVALIVFGLITNRPKANAGPWLDLDRRWFSRLGAMAVVQGAIGYLQYGTGVPVGLVAIHIAGSVILWTLVCWYGMVTSYPEVEPSTRPASELVS